MLNYILKRNADGTVDYLMKQKGCNVTGKTQFESALGLLRLAKKDVRASAEFPEYPITADGVYHFKGEYEEMEPPEIGADGLPILATDGKKKPAKKKRIKDVVCE